MWIQRSRKRYRYGGSSRWELFTMLSHPQATPLRNPWLGSEPQHHRPPGSLPDSHRGGEKGRRQGDGEEKSQQVGVWVIRNENFLISISCFKLVSSTQGVPLSQAIRANTSMYGKKTETQEGEGPAQYPTESVAEPMSPPPLWPQHGGLCAPWSPSAAP